MAVTLVWPSASRSEDAAALALYDLAQAAGSDVEYRVIGGNMAALHAARFETTLAPRATADADAGITPNAAAAASLDEQIRALGYARVDGSRYVRMHGDLELVIDLLVSDQVAGQHNVEVGPVYADAAPGLAVALARAPHIVDLDVVLTDGTDVSLSLPLPDSAAAVILKSLAWKARLEDKDAIDTFRLLEVWYLERKSVHLLRSGVTTTRALEVLESSFVPRRGQAVKLPPAHQTQARLYANSFVREAVTPAQEP